MAWKKWALAGVALAWSVAAASAQTTVKWLHIEVNPNQVKLWEEVARAYEAKNPGVKVEMSFLENEAYKAKAPTLLQSKDRPHIILSWAGGVLQSQVEAGVIEDITEQAKGFVDTLAPAAVEAFKVNGKLYGVPMNLSQVGFMYNKELFAKAGVDATKIKSWDDLLGAVKQIKAAGITPIVVGGADKWPLHFYWTLMAVRLGGKDGIVQAMKGDNGGFESETYVKAAELYKQLVDLQPFQNGFLGFKNPQAVGAFGDGKGAMILAISSFYHTQKALAADKVGISDDKIGWFEFPMVPGAKGDPTDTLGGINGWLITKGAPKEALDFVKALVSKDVQTKQAAANFIIPVVKGADEGIVSPFMKNIAGNIARSKYHQNFYDQALGPNVGRVINDASAEIAGGSMTPKQAAKAVNDAWKTGN